MKTADSRYLKQSGAGSATVILAILLVLLVAVTAYLLVTYYSQNSALENLKKQLTDTQFDLRQTSNSLVLAEQDKQDANRERNDLRKKLLDVQTAGDDKYRALLQQVDEHKRQQQQANNDLLQQKEKLAECDALAGQLEAANKRIEKLTPLGQALENCQKELDDSKGALLACRDTGNSSREKANDLEKMAQELATCRQQLAQKDTVQLSEPVPSPPKDVLSKDVLSEDVVSEDVVSKDVLSEDVKPEIVKPEAVMPESETPARQSDSTPLRADGDKPPHQTPVQQRSATTQEKNETDKNEPDPAIAALQSQIAQLEADLDSCRARQQELAGNTDAVEAAAAQIAALEKQLTELTGKLDACSADLQVASGKATEEEVAEVKKTYESLIQDLKQEIKDKEVNIEQFRDKVKIQIVGQILFPFGRAKITASGKEVLHKLQHTLGEIEHKQIYVIGHTDDVAIKAAFFHWAASNWELSAKRAASVVRYLIDEAGVQPARLAAVGRSQYDPVDSNDTREGRAHNRRVEIVVSNDLRLR